VMGNSNYKFASLLKNPKNDAELMKTTLQNLGFEVICVTDATRETMLNAIKQFREKIKDAQVTFFYYAGHGMQAKGINYLIPVDVNLETIDDAELYAVALGTIIKSFQDYNDKMNIVVLDACRNNPFRNLEHKIRADERGFKAESTSGILVAFAANQGEYASDGTGKNGLYTQYLVQELQKSQRIEDVFTHTRVNVRKASEGKQNPQVWLEIDKTGFYLKKTGQNDNENNNSEPEKIVINKTKAKGKVFLTTETTGILFVDDVKRDNLAQGDELNFDLTIGKHIIEVRDNSGKTIWKQKCEIAKNSTTNLLVKVEIEKPKETEFTESVTGIIYNWYSANAWAWDLVNNRSSRSEDADGDKDMANPGTTDWSFKKEWYSKNGTLFVKNNSFNYNNPTVEAAAAAFSGGSTSISVSQGDIIIAKLRGQDEFVVIKITEIRETSIENNDDYIKFEYKKRQK